MNTYERRASQLHDWEVSVRDADGRVVTFTYRVTNRREALDEFRERSGWSARKLQHRLVRCDIQE